MGCFLGIGLGPIQTGIFLSGAEGRFDRLVVADVDAALVASVRAGGGEIRLNVASADRVFHRTIRGVEVFNPADPEDMDALICAVSEADEICTALPSVAFFAKIAGWLRRGFEASPEHRRFVYTAENHNHAAEMLAAEIGPGFPQTFCLNTVIGKMSGVVSAEECRGRGLLELAPGAGRGHLVEEFNRILVSTCPGIEERKIAGLHVKDNLLPFEEAKLYGHNAVHFLLGIHASANGLSYMHELSKHPDIVEIGKKAFIEESGAALLGKWRDEKDFFDEKGFRAYAQDLLGRMLNPFLRDSVDRVCRDIGRKLGWDDRMVGTIRLCISQGVLCNQFAKGAKLAARRLFPPDVQDCEIRRRLKSIWGNVPEPEAEAVLDLLGSRSENIH